LQYEGLSDLHLQFSEPIERFTQNYVDLRGIKLLNYNPLITNITYDQTLQRGVIQMRESISNDRLMLFVADLDVQLDGQLDALEMLEM
jgi:hypothetical protein